MFELLYAVVFKALGIPGLCALSMAVEWRMAHWLSSCMADDTSRDKSSTMVMKNAQLVPGAYLDEVFLFCVASQLRSTSTRKLSLPGSRTLIMPSTEICASPTEDDHGGALVHGFFEDLQSGSEAGYLLDHDVRFSGRFQGCRLTDPPFAYLPGHRCRI